MHRNHSGQRDKQKDKRPSHFDFDLSDGEKEDEGFQIVKPNESYSPPSTPSETADKNNSPSPVLAKPTAPALHKKPREHYLEAIDADNNLLLILKGENRLTPLTEEQLKHFYAPDGAIDMEKWKQLMHFALEIPGEESVYLHEQRFYLFLKEVSTKKSSGCCSRLFKKDAASNKQEWLFLWTLLAGDIDGDNKQFIKTNDLINFLQNPESYVQTFMRKRSLLIVQQHAQLTNNISRLEI